MFACKKAVKQEPNNAGFLDSRGVARALIGDYDGAIKDFKFFVQRTSDDAIEKRKLWIQSLEKGKDPFTDEVLQELFAE